MDIKYTTRKLPEYKVQAQEVVRELNDQPHLLVRVNVSGEHFPHRAPHPFIHIRTSDDSMITDLFTEVSPDNQELIGYLPVTMPEGGIVEFGYGDEIWGRVPFGTQAETRLPARLDRKRLPDNIVVVDDSFMKRMKK